MKSKRLLMALIQCLLFFPLCHSQTATPSLEETRINSMLTEAASPTIPIFSSQQQEKSKFELYSNVMHLLSKPSIKPVTARKAIENFLEDITNVVINTPHVTQDQLTNVKKIVKQAEDILIMQAQQLKDNPITTANEHQDNIGENITQLLSKHRILSSKIKLQNDFLRLLKKTKLLPQQQLAVKIEHYKTILPQIDNNIIASSRQEYLNDLSQLASWAKNSAYETAYVKLLDDAMIHLPEQKTTLTSLKSLFNPHTLGLVAQNAPQPPADFNFLLPPPPPATTSQPSSQTRLTLPPPPGVKKSLTSTYQKKPTRSQKKDKKTKSSRSIASKSKKTKSASKKIQKSLLPPSPSAKSSPGKAKKTKKSKSAAKPKKSKKTSRKVQLKKIPMPVVSAINYELIINECAKYIAHLATKISQEEKDQIKQFLKEILPKLYNERANKPLQEIQALKTLFSQVAKNKEIAPLIAKNQHETLNALIHITTARNQPNNADKIKWLYSALKALNSKTNDFEKQLFSDLIASLFNTRRTLTKNELTQLSQFLSTLTSKKTRKRKIFDAKTTASFEEYANIIQSTLTLTSPPPQRSFKDLVILYQKTIPALSYPNANYEREFFISRTLPALFSHRGNLKGDELKTLHTFFDKILKTPNVLAANQVPVMTLWQQEIAKAQTISTPTKTYLEGLITQAEATKNIANYTAALRLFTQHTAEPLRRAFIIAVNKLFIQRQTVDKKQLLAFLEELGRKKLGETSSFLSDLQKQKLNEWIAALSAEIKGSK